MIPQNISILNIASGVEVETDPICDLDITIKNPWLWTALEVGWEELASILEMDWAYFDLEKQGERIG